MTPMFFKPRHDLLAKIETAELRRHAALYAETIDRLTRKTRPATPSRSSSSTTRGATCWPRSRAGRRRPPGARRSAGSPAS